MTLPSLKISLLGGVQIELNGTVLGGFASRKAEGLFIYLVCQPRPWPRETLAALFWPENSQSRALANLSVVLSSLRKELGEYLQIERHTISFLAETAYWLDVQEFERGLTAVPHSSHNSLNRTAARQLASAVALYQGDFLTGFSLRGTSEFESWVLLEQERLRQLLFDGLTELIAYALQREQFSEGIAYAQQLLTFDPLQESVQRELMRLLAFNGQRAQALAQFESCAAVLAAELGIEPAAETEALYEAIKADQLIPERAAAGHTAAQPRHNLPLAATPFIGRENDLAYIDRWLAAPHGRLLTLLGPGGIGKTRLALESLRQHQHEFADGVWYVSLVSLTTIDDVIRKIVESLSLTFGSQEEPVAQLTEQLRGRELLLLLDNFEQLIVEETLAFLTTLLTAVPQLHLLVTSRKRLNLQAEQLYELSGLPHPDTADDLLTVAQAPAVLLFSNRATRLMAEFAITGQETAVLRLCQLTAGMPLALELAATWIRTLTLPEIVAELEAGLDILATTMQDVPDRHRSLRAVCAYSWRLLTAAEQQAFAKLSVFQGGFTRQTAKVVTGTTLPVLAGLADKAFIRLDEDGRYRRHPLLIQFAAEQLAQRPQLEQETYMAHALYFADVMAAMERNFKINQTQYIRELEFEGSNIRQAWMWAITHRPPLLRKMAPVMGGLLVRRGLFREGLALFTKAAAAFSAELEPAGIAIIKTHLGMFHRALGHSDEARRLMLEGLALYDQQTGSDSEMMWREEAFALHQYGYHLLFTEAKMDQAEDVFNQALDLYKKADDLLSQSDILFSKAVIAYYRSQYQQATLLAERAIAYGQTAGSSAGLIQPYQLSGMLQIAQGNFEAGIGRLNEAIKFSEMAHSETHIGYLKINIGLAQLLMGQFAEAEQTLQDALLHEEKLGDPQGKADAQALLGFVYVHSGRIDQAQQLGEQAILDAGSGGFVFQQGFSRLLAGYVLVWQGAFQQAFETIEKGVEFLQESEIIEYETWAYPALITAAFRLGRHHRARRLLERSLECATINKSVVAMTMMTASAVVWHLYEGDIQKAMQLYVQIEKRPFVSQSHWFAPILTRPLQEAAAALPEDARQNLPATAVSFSHAKLLDFATPTA